MSDITDLQAQCKEYVTKLLPYINDVTSLINSGEWDPVIAGLNDFKQNCLDMSTVCQVFIYDKFGNFEDLINTTTQALFESPSDNAKEAFKELLLNIREVIDYVITREEKVCTCCGKKMFYCHLSFEAENRFGHISLPNHQNETLNREEYYCPICQCCDRDRLIIEFLKKLQLTEAVPGEKILQLAPAFSIEQWILGHSPIVYETTDLFMDSVTFKSDIQNMSCVKDGEYDYFICSHILEHVEDDKKAMRELSRILKDDGLGIFLVPVWLDTKQIYEEWGLSPEENLYRFGQEDHCRSYSKEGLIERLQNNGFFVHQLGKDFFGAEFFKNAGLLDTSTLYVLSKKDEPIEDLIKKIIDKRKSFTPKNPLVSVVLPTYNHEAYVGAAIESVLNQTYKNIEFLVADDASTDGTKDEILKYEDKIDQIHLFEQNTGSRISRFLIDNSTGKFIAMMHSDDLWAADKLRKQVNYMENHPECDACFTGVQLIDENGNYLESDLFNTKNMSKENWLRFFFYNMNHLAHPSIMIKTSLYQKLIIGRNVKGFRQLPDFSMWVSLVQHSEIHVIQEPLTIFRFHLNETNTNTSAPNQTNQVRTAIECSYLWGDVFRHMEPEVFVNAFKQDMLFKEAQDVPHIECEKMLLLLKKIPSEGARYAYELFNDETITEVLESDYGFTPKSLADIVVKIQF